MKFRKNVLIQIIALAIVVVISYGFVGSNEFRNTESLVRRILQLSATLGVLISFGTTILAFRMDAGRNYKELAFFALTGSIIAVLATVNLSSVSNFSQTLYILRASSTFGMLISIFLYTQAKPK